MSQREREMWREALRATSLGWDLALPIFGGVLVGYILDRSLGSTHVFVLGFMIFGIAAGFYNVLRSIQRMDQRCRKRGDDRDEEEPTSRVTP